MHFLKQMMQQADDWRVQWRFRWVELRVRRESTDHLSDDLKQARQRNLDELRRYWQQGIFPRNYEYEQQKPVFIDPDGRHCAVAHLVTKSGHADVAQTISQQANFALVPAMNYPELDSWAQTNGFTRAELARIQPTYGPDVTDPVTFAALMSLAHNYLNILGFMLLVSIGSMVLQVIAMFRGVPQPRWPVWMIVSGLLTAGFSGTVIYGLLREMRTLFHDGGPPFTTGMESFQFLAVETWAGLGIIIGLPTAMIGILILASRYWRARQKSQAVNITIKQLK